MAQSNGIGIADKLLGSQGDCKRAEPLLMVAGTLLRQTCRVAQKARRCAPSGTLWGPRSALFLLGLSSSRSSTWPATPSSSETLGIWPFVASYPLYTGLHNAFVAVVDRYMHSSGAKIILARLGSALGVLGQGAVRKGAWQAFQLR